MQFTLTGRVDLTLEHKKGQDSSSHVHTDFRLYVSDNIKDSDFLNDDETPSKTGVKALTQCFIQGLLGSIHYAHQKKYWDSAKHLRYIMSELERGFILVSEISESQFKNNIDENRQP